DGKLCFKKWDAVSRPISRLITEPLQWTCRRRASSRGSLEIRTISISVLLSPMPAPQIREFLKLDRQLLQATLRLNTMAHLNITHHFGAKLVERRRGGLILIGSTGAEIGVPFLANDGGAKAYIHSLGEALHYEFKPRGVYVTVVPPPLTDTPVLAKLGFDARTMPMKPMSVEQCVSEGLNALRENRSRIVSGRLNRFMDAFVPAFVKRTFTAKMLGKALANKHIVAKEFGGSRCPTPS